MRNFQELVLPRLRSPDQTVVMFGNVSSCYNWYIVTITTNKIAQFSVTCGSRGTMSWNSASESILTSHVVLSGGGPGHRWSCGQFMCVAVGQPTHTVGSACSDLDGSSVCLCVDVPFLQLHPGRHRPGSSVDWRRLELWRHPPSSLQEQIKVTISNVHFLFPVPCELHSWSGISD